MNNSRILQRFRLDGKVAIITGASKGIGESMARGLAEFGAKVVISSRKQEAVDEVAANFSNDGLEAIGIACHVAQAEAREALVQKTIDTYGRVDILINNAGTNPYFGPIHKMPAEAYQKTLDINLNAALELSNLFFPHLKAQGEGGSIIHISSVEGLHASENFGAYNISKAGLLMLTKSQAVEWGKHNIRVNAICPGFVKTKLSAMIWQNEQMHERLVSRTPLRRMAMPDDMAGLAVFLASEASNFCTGEVIVNDGGLLHAPSF
ncbi:MAG: SDR family oxidoreductase [Bacteroidota bacterium]